MVAVQPIKMYNKASLCVHYNAFYEMPLFEEILLTGFCFCL